MAKVKITRNIVESFNLSRAHERYRDREMIDGFAIAKTRM